MGWSSGSDLMTEVIMSAMKHVPDSSRKKFYKEMIEAFENCDCDTLHECVGADRFFDAAFDYFHPSED